MVEINILSTEEVKKTITLGRKNMFWAHIEVKKIKKIHPVSEIKKNWPGTNSSPPSNI